MKILKRMIYLLCFSLVFVFCMKRLSNSENSLKYVDVHVHLHGKGKIANHFEDAAAIAVSGMDRWGIQRMLVLPPPFTNQASQMNALYDCPDMTGVLMKYPGRFGLLCGGGTLNVMIQEAVTGGNVSVEEFKNQARKLAETKGFVGFGEMTAEHFCLSAKGKHVYQSAPPDHHLFKALVDVASERNVPIDIHMEAVQEDMPLPVLVTEATQGKCPANPLMLKNNIRGLKNLLDYAKSKNPPVNIVWSHAGWDNTQKRTVALCDKLMGRYSNLFMSIKVSPMDSLEDGRTVDGNGNIKPEWLKLFKKYPTQFMLGSDHFFTPHTGQRVGPPSFGETWAVLRQLPPDLATKISYENAKTIFHLK